MMIFYFGGYRSTHDDVVVWANSIEKKLPGVAVTPFRYPDGASAGNPLAKWRYESTEWIVSRMEDGDLIVGHSSGCAIANDVAEHALFEGKKFKLICLDGFCPNQKLLALPDTQVWSAEYLDYPSDCAYSLNFRELQECVPTNRFYAYQAKVSHRWPLHFSLVNLNVSDDYDTITDGYRNCDANLEVLGLSSAGIA